MTPETARAEAMAFENRPNPYPFFDETGRPVVRGESIWWSQATGSSSLAHDPGHSASVPGRPAGAEPPPGPNIEAYGRAKTMSVRPPDHDRTRPGVRHSSPPHSPTSSADGGGVRGSPRAVDKARGRPGSTSSTSTPIRCRCRDCKILGVPLKDEPTFTAGSLILWRAHGPESHQEGKPA
jgi:hypothetical protein